MRILDILQNYEKAWQERATLQALQTRASRYITEAEGYRQEFCAEVVNEIIGLSTGDPSVICAALLLCHGLLAYEGHLHLPAVDIRGRLTIAEAWKAKAALINALQPFEEPRVRALLGDMLKSFLRELTGELPPPARGGGGGDSEDSGLAVPLYAHLRNVPETVEALLRLPYREDLIRTNLFENMRIQFHRNICLASGIDPDRAEKSSKALVSPTKAYLPASELITTYLTGMPFVDFLQTQIHFSIPFRTRFEHTHIAGGSGHGKTQLLQHLILRDLRALEADRGSLIVIDSQGDMLRTITQLSELSPTHPAGLAERLVLIDPNDIEHPPALNLFDFGLERLNRYSPVEREKLINGAIALYEYVFGALLGAELTQRQGVIFRYLARLIMTIPGATIHTLMRFMEDPEATRAYFPKLDTTSCHFFETQFFFRSFDDTRQQILTRLWGVLSNRVLERMFTNQHNKLDLFAAMNRGSLICINTAKDLLKQEGCEILGRFFIALITQAAQERAAIPEERRRSTFVYIDEAHDYFDESIQNLFNQARKYHVGLIIAHQNLDQFDATLRATVMASTSTKLVGGLSAKDAAAFAREMNCEPEFLQGMRKHRNHTEFACFVRNFTPQPIRLTVPFGEMERQAKISAAEYAAILEGNRRCFAGGGAEPVSPADRQIGSEAGGPGLGTPDLL